jgi:hypothetical protein
VEADAIAEAAARGTISHHDPDPDEAAEAA